MKLSQLTTEQAFNTLAAITPPLTRILKDPAVMDAVGTPVELDKISGYGLRAKRLDMFASVVDIAVNAHRDDLFSVLAAVNQTDMETVKQQKMTDTFRQIREMCEDPDLMDFLESFTPQEKKASSAPSAGAQGSSGQKEF